VKAAHPDIRVLGIDINPRAIKSARNLRPEIDFELADAHHWTQTPDS